MSAPTDLSRERERRKLANATRQAALHATPAELVELRKLAHAVNAGILPIDEARSIVSELRRHQQARQKWPPEPVERHDPDACSSMVCEENACRIRNGHRQPQGDGNASAFRAA